MKRAETALFKEKAIICSYSDFRKKQNTRGTFLICELHQAQFCSYVKHVAKLQNAAGLSPMLSQAFK